MNREEQICAQRARVVLEALSWVGTPYRHQASIKNHGTDCLGVLRGVYRMLFGAEPVSVPPYPADPRAWPDGEPLLFAAQNHLLLQAKAPQAGDALFFKMRARGPVSHCGVHIGYDRFVHAYSGYGVISSELTRGWRAKLAHVFSFPEVQ